MKTKTLITVLTVKERVEFIIATLIGRKSLALMLLVLTLNVNSQEDRRSNRSFGVSLYGQLSANGYGSMRIPTLVYKNARQTFSVGFNIQKCRKIVSGIQFNYSYAVTGPNIPGKEEDVPELYFFVSSAYNFNTKLGKTNLRNEYMANRTATENHVSSLHFQSTELFAGAGLRIKFLKRFTWDNSVGLGGNYSFNFPDALELYYTKVNVGLQLRTGITCAIFN